MEYWRTAPPPAMVRLSNTVHPEAMFIPRNRISRRRKQETYPTVFPNLFSRSPPQTADKLALGSSSSLLALIFICSP